jgi:hypothetical protein
MSRYKAYPEYKDSGVMGSIACRLIGALRRLNTFLTLGVAA